MSESVSTDFGGLGKKGAIFLTLKQGQLLFTQRQSQPKLGGGRERRISYLKTGSPIFDLIAESVSTDFGESGREGVKFLTLKQGQLFLTLRQSLCLVTLL